VVHESPVNEHAAIRAVDEPHVAVDRDDDAVSVGDCRIRDDESVPRRPPERR